MRSKIEGEAGCKKRAHGLYNKRNLTPRTPAALYSKLTGLERGGMSRMKKEEIEGLVRKEEEDLAEDVRLAMVGMLDWIDTNEGFEESDEGEFEGFEIKEADGIETRERVEDGKADEIDMSVARRIDFSVEAMSEVNVVLVGDEGGRDDDTVVEVMDTWKETDGTTRAVTEVEAEVLVLLREVQTATTWEEVPSLRAVDRKNVMKEVGLVDGLMHNLVWDGMSVTDVNRLLYAGGVVVARRLGLKIGGGKRARGASRRTSRPGGRSWGRWRRLGREWW